MNTHIYWHSSTPYHFYPYGHACDISIIHCVLSHDTVTIVNVCAVQRPSLHYEPEEGIYEAPASSVSGLYAQYEKIRITFIPRTAIE